jgi:hypothetical protein
LSTVDAVARVMSGLRPQVRDGRVRANKAQTVHMAIEVNAICV